MWRIVELSFCFVIEKMIKGDLDNDRGIGREDIEAPRRCMQLALKRLVIDTTTWLDSLYYPLQ